MKSYLIDHVEAKLVIAKCQGRWRPEADVEGDIGVTVSLYGALRLLVLETIKARLAKYGARRASRIRASSETADSRSGTWSLDIHPDDAIEGSRSERCLAHLRLSGALPVLYFKGQEAQSRLSAAQIRFITGRILVSKLEQFRSRE